MTTAARNVLIGAGAFITSRWGADLLRLACGALASALVTHDRTTGAVVTPLVTSLPIAIGAAFAGIATALLVTETTSPSRWAVVPAVLWLLASADALLAPASSWFEQGALLLAVAAPPAICLAAGRMAGWHRDPR